MRRTSKCIKCGDKVDAFHIERDPYDPAVGDVAHQTFTCCGFVWTVRRCSG